MARVMQSRNLCEFANASDRSKLFITTDLPLEEEQGCRE
jgi:hypothetical protein